MPGLLGCLSLVLLGTTASVCEGKGVGRVPWKPPFHHGPCLQALEAPSQLLIPRAPYHCPWESSKSSQCNYPRALGFLFCERHGAVAQQM